MSALGDPLGMSGGKRSDQDGCKLQPVVMSSRNDTMADADQSIIDEPRRTEVEVEKMERYCSYINVCVLQ